MTRSSSFRRGLRTNTLAAATIAAAWLGILQPAAAGECPADKRGADLTKSVNIPAKGVSDTVLTAIDLAGEPARIQGRELRLRKLVMSPAVSCPGTATATGPRSSISSKG